MTNEMTNQTQGLEDPTRELEELFELVQALVRIPSDTGTEGRVAHFIHEWLVREGIDASLEYVPTTWEKWPEETDLDQRPNVVARLRGTHVTHAPFVLNGHIDTVPTGDPTAWTVDPHGAQRSDGRIHGRGTTDMKAGIAVSLMTIRHLARHQTDLPFDIVLQCVIGEETGGIGTHHLFDADPTAGAAIILEPTGGSVYTACGGTAPFTVETYGKSAHVGTPWVGVDALEQIIRVHTRLRELEAERITRLSHPVLDKLPNKAPVSFGVLKSGEWRLTTPDYAILQGRIGTMPDEELDDVRSEVQHIIDTEAAATPGGTAPPSLTWHNGFNGWSLPQSHPLAVALLTANSTHGGSSEPGCATYGSDASVFARHGVPVLLFGPGELVQAHAADEFVDEEIVGRCYQVLKQAIRDYAAKVRADGEGSS